MADGYLIGPDFLGRIRRTVDAAEAAPMRLQTGKIAVRLEGEGEAAPPRLKLCKTTSEWGYGTTAVLDVYNDNSTYPDAGPSETGETIEAINLTAKVAAQTFVLVGKAVHGFWYLVEIGRECEEGSRAARLTEADLDDSIASTPLETDIGPQVLVHDEGCLRWASLRKITVLTAVNLTETGLVFDRDEIWTFPDANSSIESTEIETTDCPPPEPPPE